MKACIGIRREDKSIWERRVPIIPEHARQLQQEHGIKVQVQPSDTRVFSDEAFRQAGAHVTDDLSCPVVFAVKEIPLDFFEPNHTYIFFAHIIKGQSYNMPMLQKMLDVGCTLIDYEKVTDAQGRRLIFFGYHAGLVGMIDTLWALGRRLDWEGIANPFSQLYQARQYDGLDEAKAAVAAVGERITREGLPKELVPFVCGFAGYGNVFRGANEIIELLPVRDVQPHELDHLMREEHQASGLYKVVFKEKNTVEPVSSADRFDLQDYYDHPEKYRSKFHQHLPHLTLLVNCIYWEEKYPRLVTKQDLRELYGREDQPRLRVIGDISCDVEGAIEATLRCTELDNPLFVYDPFDERARDGVAGRGPVILAVDILPSELPREASVYVSGKLLDYVPAIARADYSVPFEELDLPPEIKRAVVVHHGELTPDYRYLEEYL